MESQFPELDAITDEFIEKVRILCEDYKEKLGPNTILCEEHGPNGETFVSRVVVLATWLDADGDEFTTMFHPSRMPAYVIDGLLLSHSRMTAPD